MSQRAAQDPTVTTFEAIVERVDGRAVVLDETYFYAESGGQPADRGTLGDHTVEHVREEDGEIVHLLDEEPTLEPGDVVSGDVDDEFRTYAMRAHTASHLLYGAARRLLSGLGYGGFDIGTEKVRVDFVSDDPIDDDVLVDLERLTNRAVWESRAVSWEEIDVAEARERDEIAFNTKTEEGVMADADAVRVVTIEGWDWAACGGTHVANTREIGPVEVLGRSNPGEGLTRVEFAVGPPAVERSADVKRATLAAGTVLDASPDALDEAARDLVGKVDALEAEVAALTAAALDGALADLDPVVYDGVTWYAGTVDGFGPNDVGDRLKATVGSETPAAVVAGEDGGTYVVAAVDPADSDADAGDLVDAITDEFGGGGGGGPPFAQGGGIDASPEDVVAFLEE